jgi:hypothetical protein
VSEGKPVGPVGPVKPVPPPPVPDGPVGPVMGIGKGTDIGEGPQFIFLLIINKKFNN